MRKLASRRVVTIAAAATAGATALVGITLITMPSNAAAAPAAPFDFNGDGRRDLAIGSPDASVAAKAGAGLVTVVYGGANGPDTAKRRVISQYGAPVAGEPEAGDKFGAAIDSADVDQDGFADLIIGAPGESTTDGARAGTVTFGYGSATGFTFETVSAQFPIAEDRYGETVTTGDIDNDGFPEAIAGGPGTEYVDVWTWAPAQAGVTTAATKPRVKRVALPGNKGIAAQAIGAEFMKIDAADVFGDAGAEIVLLWRDEEGGTAVDRGHLAMLHADGTGGLPWTTPVVMTGHTLAVGDLDSDARPEIAVGQYSNSGFNGGQVTVYQPTNADPFIDTATARRIHQDITGIPGAAEAGDRFGRSLSIGDADNDGFGDLAVGVPGEDLTGGADAGAVVFIYGSATGPNTGRTWAINQETSNIPGGSEAKDQFGHATTQLDFTGDGKTELAIGSPGENGTQGMITTLKGGLTSVGASAFLPSAVGVTTTARLGSVLGR